MKMWIGRIVTGLAAVLLSWIVFFGLLNINWEPRIFTGTVWIPGPPLSTHLYDEFNEARGKGKVKEVDLATFMGRKPSLSDVVREDRVSKSDSPLEPALVYYGGLVDGSFVTSELKAEQTLPLAISRAYETPWQTYKFDRLSGKVIVTGQPNTGALYLFALIFAAVIGASAGFTLLEKPPWLLGWVATGMGNVAAFLLWCTLGGQAFQMEGVLASFWCGVAAFWIALAVWEAFLNDSATGEKISFSLVIAGMGTLVEVFFIVCPAASVATDPWAIAGLFAVFGVVALVLDGCFYFRPQTAKQPN